MNKKTLIFVLKTTIILTFIIFIVFLLYKNNSIQNNMNKQIDKLSESNKKLTLKIKELELKQNNNNSNFNCEYVKTYKFIEKYNFIGTVPSSEFIVVDEFQLYSPTILEFNKDKIKIDFIENNFYEITFSSVVIEGLETKRIIKKIEQTDKIGYEQLQEQCKKES